MAKSPLKLAIFDIDGTLRRVRDPWIHLHNHLGVADQAKDFPARWQKGEISYNEWESLTQLYGAVIPVKRSLKPWNITNCVSVPES